MNINFMAERAVLRNCSDCEILCFFSFLKEFLHFFLLFFPFLKLLLQTISVFIERFVRVQAVTTESNGSKPQ